MSGACSILVLRRAWFPRFWPPFFNLKKRSGRRLQSNLSRTPSVQWRKSLVLTGRVAPVGIALAADSTKEMISECLGCLVQDCPSGQMCSDAQFPPLIHGLPHESCECEPPKSARRCPCVEVFATTARYSNSVVLSDLPDVSGRWQTPDCHSACGRQATHSFNPMLMLSFSSSSRLYRNMRRRDKHIG